jgi:F-type H+-transporting ATPase subunit delta
LIRRFAHPYARAIMDVAGSPEKGASIRDGLARFERARNAAPDLAEMYANPAIDFDTKLAVTRTIAKRLGLPDMAIKVLEVLIRNRRINHLDSIVEALAAMIRQATGAVAAEVRAAHRLNEQEVKQLRAVLEKKFGRKVEVEVTTDPTLLGGFVAKVGSEVYDASIAGKINKFRESLM